MTISTLYLLSLLCLVCGDKFDMPIGKPSCAKQKFSQRDLGFGKLSRFHTSGSLEFSYDHKPELLSVYMRMHARRFFPI
jgi:hypothetical protein